VEAGTVTEEEIELDLPGGRRLFHGEGNLAVAFCGDITERKKNQERLELLDFALDPVREAAFLTDESGRLRCLIVINVFPMPMVTATITNSASKIRQRIR
jgi:hypothetical protein